MDIEGRCQLQIGHFDYGMNVTTDEYDNGWIFVV